MIYLFSGDDAKNKLASYEKFLKTLPKGREFFFVNRNNFGSIQLENLYSGSSLFSSESTVVLSDILETEDMREIILPKLKAMAGSQNTFVFLERKLNKPVLDAFKKAGAKENQLNVFEQPKEKKEKFDNFLIANAFASKDKFHAWLYFRQAIEGGAALEEIAGILFWKIKDMILKKNFTKWKEEELKQSAGKISYLLPEARKKGPEAESALEQFLLEAF